MTPRSRFASLTALAAALAGCTATYTQPPPGGAYPIYAPNQSPMPSTEHNLAAPPGLLVPPPAGGMPGAGAAGVPSGIYNGEATLLENDFGGCAFRFAMTNMHVDNGRVRFASFRGRISPTGGVRMADGSMNWIVGHFGGGHFAGTYTNEYCTYTLSLDWAGS